MGVAAYDAVVVGAGFAGSVMAERLAAADGLRVLVIDRRPHIGGNAWDEHDEAGILVHRYGPHIFHTNSPEVFAYLSRFTDWRPYEHRVLASVDGQLVPMPINLDAVNRLYGLSLDSAGLERWFAERAEPRDRIETSEDAVVSKIGRALYEKFFQGYTRKQWGLDPGELGAQVASRVPARLDRDDRYFTDRFQAMPTHGYHRMFARMLDHPRITVRLDTGWQDVAAQFGADRPLLVWTGPVDEYFGRRFGPLPYRSLEFRFQTLPREWVQPVATINYPNEHEWTRTTEFKHLTGQRHDLTTIVYEHPRANGDPYYPIPRPDNAALYRRYEQLAAAETEVMFAGRLGTYRYYNMDQVVAQALALHARWSNGRNIRAGSR